MTESDVETSPVPMPPRAPDDASPQVIVAIVRRWFDNHLRSTSLDLQQRAREGLDQARVLERRSSGVAFEADPWRYMPLR